MNYVSYHLVFFSGGDKSVLSHGDKSDMSILRLTSVVNGDIITEMAESVRILRTLKRREFSWVVHSLNYIGKQAPPDTKPKLNSLHVPQYRVVHLQHLE